MKIDAKSLETLASRTAKSVDIPSSVWLTQIQDVFKSINDILKQYREITGKANPITTIETLKPTSFSEAREVKKTEMSNKSGGSMNEIKELLEGFIKTLNTLETIGKGDIAIGQVISELPFTVSQTKEFLMKLKISKYGG